MHTDETGHDAHNQDAHGHDAPSLDLGEDERLPWLESADEDELEPEGPSRGRLIGVALGALLVLVIAVGGVYWLTHRGGSAKPADGSLIEASKDPYKVAPANPGGKTFAGTGDESYKVSQGEHPEAHLAGGAPAPSSSSSSSASTSAPASPAPAAGAAAAPAPTHAAAAPSGSVAVQVGAYSTAALGEASWNRMVTAHDVLKGLGHRVVEGKADIGTVYRLQALTSDLQSANALCSKLQADGVKCQVKR